MGQINFHRNLFHPRVKELTMITSTIICVEIHDGNTYLGAYIQLPVPDTGPQLTWLSRPNPTLANQNDLGHVEGAGKTHFKFRDRTPVHYFQRENALNPASYGLIGTRSVIRVSHQNDVQTQGRWDALGQVHGSGQITRPTSLKHFLYLELSGPIEAGTHTINFPENTKVKPYTFTFNDKEIRCSWLKVSHYGWRRTDKGKMAVGGHWVPELGIVGEGGAISTNLTTFRILDSNLNDVGYTGQIVLHRGPFQGEGNAFGNREEVAAGLGGLGTGLQWYPDFTRPPISITAVPNTGSPVTVTAPAHGLAENAFIYMGVLFGVSGGINRRCVQVRNVTADTFQCYNIIGNPIGASTTMVSPASYPHGHHAKAWPAVLQNYTRTYTYWLEFGDWTPPSNGTYYIHIPGVGVSYPMFINDNVWLDVAKHYLKGIYHKRSGCPKDGRYGYTQPINLRDGRNGVEIVKSRLPITFGDQNGSVGSFICRVEMPGKCDSLLVNQGLDRIDANSGYMDAADFDSFAKGHNQHVYYICTLIDIFGLPAFQALNLGLPLSSDPSMELGGVGNWADADGVPNILHECIYPLSFQLRTQEADGRVPGGIDGSNQYSLWDEPSPQMAGRLYTFAPDHTTNYVYAGLACTLGRILFQAGATVLGMQFYNSAKLAFQWAETVYHKMNPNVMGLGAGTGSFTSGETITDQTTGAQATVSVGGSLQLHFYNPTGTFGVGNTVNGSVSLASRVINGVTMNTVTTFDPNFYYKPLTDFTRRVVFTANQTASQKLLTNVSSFVGLKVGDNLTGNGIVNSNLDWCIIESMDPGAGTILVRHYNDRVGQGGVFLQRSSLQPIGTTATANVITAKVMMQNPTTDASFNSQLVSLNSQAITTRIGASGMLAHAVEIIEGPAVAQTYRTIFEAIYQSSTAEGFNVLGRWQYTKTPAGSSTVKNTILSNFREGLQLTNNRNIILKTTGLDKTFPWWVMASGATCVMQPGGSDASSFVALAISVEVATPTQISDGRQEQAKNAGQRQMAVMNGMNLMGMCYSMGGGFKAVKNLLSHDAPYLADENGIPGLTPFGPSGWSGGFSNTTGFAVWDPGILTLVTDLCTTAETSIFKHRHIIHPYHIGFPGHHHWDHRECIGESEDSVSSLSNPMLCALYTHFKPNT